MKIIKTINDFNLYYENTNISELGFVPTMGALHAGHMSLVKHSKLDNSHTVVSIYINPTQFDKDSDLSNYPKSIDKDLEILSTAGVDTVFIPNYSEIYPDDYAFQIQENQLSNYFCGAHREGHFNGVLTVVMKLLNIIQPTKAYFGTKDYQQLTLVKKMVKSFFIDVEIIACPIIREVDGLAMSSRNLRLTPQQRELAPKLYQTIKQHIDINLMHKNLSDLGFTVDYIEKLDNRLLVAAYLGDIRLIDNIQYINERENL